MSHGVLKGQQTMLETINIKNCGPLQDVHWTPGPGFNVVIGENDTGKTLLLKALYALVRTVEEYGRGSDYRTFRQVLDSKLTWTFQLKRIGDLVRKGEGKKLQVEATVDNQKVFFSFGQSAEKGVGETLEPDSPRKANSIYLPAKEVLSIEAIIRQSREIDKQFGFDDTYYDLVQAVNKPPQMGKNWKSFAYARKGLGDLIGGRLEQSGKEWYFVKGKAWHPVSVTAEGIKKIAILDRLLGNRMLTPESILFIDEPEAALHPSAIIRFLDMLALLASQGVQIFMATHSYFVLKKLQILTVQKGLSVPIMSLSGGQPCASDLRDGMPENPIVDTSIALYEEELEASLGK